MIKKKITVRSYYLGLRSGGPLVVSAERGNLRFLSFFLE